MNEALREKVLHVELLVMDVDGVLTDGKALYGTDGLIAVFFNIQDGTAIKYLQRAGLKAAIITGRDVEAVRARAHELGIADVLQGVKVKLEAYEALKERLGLQDEQIAYVGDDLPDLPVMRKVGLSVAVANARPEVLAAADLITETPGGEGAVREVAELILKAQGKWDDIMARYV